MSFQSSLQEEVYSWFLKRFLLTGHRLWIWVPFLDLEYFSSIPPIMEASFPLAKVAQMPASLR